MLRQDLPLQRVKIPVITIVLKQQVPLFQNYSIYKMFHVLLCTLSMLLLCLCIVIKLFYRFWLWQVSLCHHYQHLHCSAYTVLVTCNTLLYSQTEVQRYSLKSVREVPVIDKTVCCYGVPEKNNLVSVVVSTLADIKLPLW